MRDLLAAYQPSTAEFVFVLIMVVAAPNIGIAIYDTIVHDGIIGKVIAYCYPGNPSELCAEIRKENKCEPDDQLCLGDPYQFALRGIMIFIAFGYFMVRLVVSILARRGINMMQIIISAVWGWSAIILFNFGLSDWLYYTLRNLPLPDSFPWLSNVGFIFLVDWIEPTIPVSIAELYVLIGIGFVLFSLPWIWLMHHMSKGTLEEWGLIQELD